MRGRGGDQGRDSRPAGSRSKISPMDEQQPAAEATEEDGQRPVGPAALAGEESPPQPCASTSTAAHPPPSSPSAHSSAANRRQQRLFSARAFSASKVRSPFAASSTEEGREDGVGGQQQQSHYRRGGPYRPHQFITGGRRAYLASNARGELEDRQEEEEENEEEEEEKEEMEEKMSPRQLQNVGSSKQQTGEQQLSDIEDIELGEMDGGWQQNDRRAQTSHGEGGPSLLKITAERRHKERLTRQGRSLDSPAARPSLPQRFQRRRKRLRQKTETGPPAGESLRPPTEAMAVEEAERAFSPMLDVDLAPQVDHQQQKQQKQPERKESRISVRGGEEQVMKSSSTQNGSIGGGGISVPAPPEITVTSPPVGEWLGPRTTAEQSDVESAVAERRELEGQQQRTTAAGGLNPSLIKGFSKSIARFRARNRVAADENALEQANFMSKFGMRTAGGQAALPAEGVEQQEDPLDQRDQRRLSRLRRWFSRLVFDSNENYFYYWIALVSTAYVYNLLVVIARCVFVELGAGRLWILWLGLDFSVDGIYLADMFVHSRTGYLEQGLLVRDCHRIRSLYVRSRQFLWDCASLIPLDYAALGLRWRQQPILRLNRLLRRERIQRFMEQTETRTSMPNAFRVGVVVWYIAMLIHWNACLYFLISESIGLGSDPWVYGVQNKQSLPNGINDTLTRRYIYSFYWSTLILTTIGEVPGPQQNIEFAFVTVDLMCGVLIFATIVGNVGSMIAHISAGRTDFQNRIDSIKQYMELRGVGKQLEVRVIKWFDYLWANKQGLTDAQVLKVLPDRLQAEIAMHVHFETLRKVRIFQDCEAGLLAELVLKLQLQVFSPGDYVCRKGDIGREMYIVKRGMLQVVTDDGLRVFATLSEGAVFGELSILNISGSKNGNRRTANVRSVGYTDLFVLNKNDLWIALREYPEARKILINKGRELLRKDNLLDENAPEEQKSAEELAEELHSSVRILQIRIARLVAEHTNTETKMRGRIAYLEGKLRKYRAIRSSSDEEKEAESSGESDHCWREDKQLIGLGKGRQKAGQRHKIETIEE